MQFKKTTLVMAVALAASPAAFASGGYGDSQHRPSFSKSYHEDVSVKVVNEASIKIKKSVTFDQNVAIRGGATVYGRILVNSSATAVVDDKQINHDNHVINQHHNNNATVNGNAMSGARGNIGVNVTAGDNNMQDNAAAISAADARFVFGASDAEVFVNQDSVRNTVINSGNVNNASVNGNAFRGAAGSIGVNVAAGNSNLQKNNAALAVSGGSLSTATVSNLQQSGGNSTLNAGRFDVYRDTTFVTMSGRMNGTYSGYTAGGYAGNESGRYAGYQQGNYAGTASGATGAYQSGSYRGISDQVGDLYVDNWNGQSHPGGSNVGHSDFDRYAQGAVDRNGDGGALSFNASGSYSGTSQGGYAGRESGSTSGYEAGSYAGTQRGNYAGYEVGSQSLSGTFSGYVTTTRVVYTPTANNANLGGNAFAGARGNIGVNIASGTNNLQNNSLAVAATRGARE
ncbi:MAG: hypothetical protein AABZ50_04525 [Pseudomonadota bacterium]